MAQFEEIKAKYFEKIPKINIKIEKCPQLSKQHASYHPFYIDESIDKQLDDWFKTWMYPYCQKVETIYNPKFELEVSEGNLIGINAYYETL